GPESRPDGVVDEPADSLRRQLLLQTLVDVLVNRDVEADRHLGNPVVNTVSYRGSVSGDASRNIVGRGRRPDRDTVFVSHANPEDNTFALWLTLRLGEMGVKVWCDLTKLIGGETFWDAFWAVGLSRLMRRLETDAVPRNS